MDILNTIFGLLAISFGIYSFIIRRNNPDKFGKLEKMKQFYGDKAGNVIHIVFYSIAPIALGIVLIARVIMGYAS